MILPGRKIGDPSQFRTRRADCASPEAMIRQKRQVHRECKRVDRPAGSPTTAPTKRGGPKVGWYNGWGNIGRLSKDIGARKTGSSRFEPFSFSSQQMRRTQKFLRVCPLGVRV